MATEINVMSVYVSGENSAQAKMMWIRSIHLTLSSISYIYSNLKLRLEVKLKRIPEINPAFTRKKRPHIGRITARPPRSIPSSPSIDMFSISTRAPLSATPIFEDTVPTFRHRVKDEKNGMEIDDEYGELGAAGRNIVGPGEGITSSKEYMR